MHFSGGRCHRHERTFMAEHGHAQIGWFWYALAAPRRCEVLAQNEFLFVVKSFAEVASGRPGVG